MTQDADLFKQLIEIFRVELEENLQRITEALLELEKNKLNADEAKKRTEVLFRAAHNIKGTARSMGLNEISELAHHLESMFSAIQNKKILLSPDRVNLCLDAIDGMRSAMQAVLEKKELGFDFQELSKRLQAGPQEQQQPSAHTPERRKEPVKKTASPTESPESDTIRVSLTNLDRISALMEEMQISKIAIDDHYVALTRLASKSSELSNLWAQTLFEVANEAKLSGTLQKAIAGNSDYIAEVADSLDQMQKNMRPHMNGLSLLNNSLQEELRMLRLIPAATLTQTLPRTVRDLAQELGKKIDFTVTGDEVKIDKIILENLKNPLIHLLRNAIDHGIGTESERESKGKNKAGKIKLDIHQEGNQIVFTLSDDGKGIDTQTVASVALAKNLISSAELNTLSEDKILNLIFHPGFSTKETVTSVSGRGVGLDVVKSNLESLKGQVKVETTLGQGTTFTLRLPLTLVSERGLMLKSGGHFFVLPTSSIERVLTLSAEQIINVETTQAILLDEHPVPLRILADILKLEKMEPALPERIFIAVIRKGMQLAALLVDDIIGEREIVVKPLQAPMSKAPCVAGATLSGTGQVIIVLNPNDLINQALHLKSRVPFRSASDKTKTQARPHILVVDDSITTRTLEKNVLESKDYQVTVAVNGKEAWDLLQKQSFSLLVTDVSMPIMDGFTLTERVKQSPDLKDLPVIIVTSLGSDAEKKRGIEAGANAYIVKNEFESSQLLEFIAQLV